jgi:HPr Serine kinase C-terminal domain
LGPAALFAASIGATLMLEEVLTDAAVQLRMRLAYSQCCTFAGKPVVVRSNSAAILNYVVGFFSPRNDPGRTLDAAPVITLIMSDRQTHEHQDAPWFRGRGYFALARFTGADAVWFNLRSRTAFGVFSSRLVSDPDRWRKDILPTVAGILAPVISIAPVHAACLSTSGAGVLLTGPSGIGKSTLAITLARLGYRFLADEWTYLAESNGEALAWSLPVPVKLLPDAITYFPELSSYRCTTSLNGELAYEVSPQQCFTLSRAASCRVVSIVLLERSAERGCRIEPITPSEAISRLAADIEPLTGQLAPAYQQQLATLHKLSHSDCFRFLFNAPPLPAARAIHHALNRIFDRIRSDMCCDEAFSHPALSFRPE